MELIKKSNPPIQMTLVNINECYDMCIVINELVNINEYNSKYFKLFIITNHTVCKNNCKDLFRFYFILDFTVFFSVQKTE